MSSDDPGPRGEIEYRERPRSYVEVLGVAVVVAVGFVIDLAFDVHGAVTHLPGWLVALALLAGIDAIFVASARATRTLTVTADEVWVGDEMVPRAAISGAVPPDRRDLPVLGWPNGKPGRTKGVALQLDDGRDVLVPSRRPERLAGVLGAVEAPPRAPAEIRPMRPDEADLLAEIDARADIVFGLSGIELPDIDFAVPDDALAVFVVDDPPVGFVVLTEVDGHAHVAEIAVLPSVMRTGLGSRLLEHACEWAAGQGYGAVTLSTFADVAWNGPWYAGHGFVEIEPDTDGLRAVREREAALGLDAAGRRIIMRRAPA